MNNTIIFSDELELQYFIEDLNHRGFRKDKNTLTYTHHSMPNHKVILYPSALAADIMHNDNLLLLDTNSGNDNHTLQTSGD